MSTLVVVATVARSPVSKDKQANCQARPRSHCHGLFSEADVDSRLWEGWLAQVYGANFDRTKHAQQDSSNHRWRNDVADQCHDLRLRKLGREDRRCHARLRRRRPPQASQHFPRTQLTPLVKEL